MFSRFFLLSALIGHVSFTSVFKLLNKTFDILVDWLIKVCFPAGTECFGTVAAPESGGSAPELSLSVNIKHGKTPRSSVALNMPSSLYSSSRL